MKKYDKRGMVLTNDYVQNIRFVCVCDIFTASWTLRTWC